MTFENVSLQPGKKTDVKVDVRVDVNVPKPGVGVIPPTGKDSRTKNIEVELLGVGYHHLKDQPYWQPNGSALENPLVREPSVLSLNADSDDAARFREFQFQIRGLPKGSAVRTVLGPLFAVSSTQSDDVWRGLATSGPFPADTATLRIGLTTRPFEKPALIAADGLETDTSQVPADLKPLYAQFRPIRSRQDEGKAWSAKATFMSSLTISV